MQSSEFSPCAAASCKRQPPVSPDSRICGPGLASLPDPTWWPSLCRVLDTLSRPYVGQSKGWSQGITVHPRSTCTALRSIVHVFAQWEAASAGRVNLSGSRIQLGFSNPKGKTFSIFTSRLSTTPFPAGRCPSGIAWPAKQRVTG